VADLVWYLFSSGGAIVLLAAAIVWTLVSPRSSAARRALGALALFYWVTSTDIIPDTLRRLLASGYTPLAHQQVPAGRTAVVLLGSGSLRFRDWSDNQFAVVDPIGASRLLEAARVFRLLEAEYVISSGGLITPTDRTRPSGQTMAEALVMLGVPKERILVESESRTTRHEAVIIKEMLAAHPVEHVVLVTSQFHMRRSVGTFKAIGIDVVPAIVREPQGFDTWWEQLVPTDKGLKDSAMAAHEVFGLVFYAARGWFRF
jgi:uncharacterized SAM-binding protein YcdF (DUF218 family)